MTIVAQEMDEAVWAGWYRAMKQQAGVSEVAAVPVVPEPPTEFKEWDGRVFEFMGEYDSDVIPHSRKVAMRNRRTVWYPVYVCKATGERCVRADIVLNEKPVTALLPQFVIGIPDVSEEEMAAIFSRPRVWGGERDEDGIDELAYQTTHGRHA